MICGWPPPRKYNQSAPPKKKDEKTQLSDVNIRALLPPSLTSPRALELTGVVNLRMTATVPIFCPGLSCPQEDECSQRSQRKHLPIRASVVSSPLSGSHDSGFPAFAPPSSLGNTACHSCANVRGIIPFLRPNPSSGAGAATAII